jgi:ferredoxin
MSERVIVKDSCIWCGACVAVCPEVFVFGDEWQAYVKESTDLNNTLSINDAKSVCPVEAIQYE